MGQLVCEIVPVNKPSKRRTLCAGFVNFFLFSLFRMSNTIKALCKAYFSMYIIYNSISISTQWAVAGPHLQLASLQIAQPLENLATINYSVLNGSLAPKERPSTFACKSKNADRQDWYTCISIVVCLLLSLDLWRPDKDTRSYR